MKGRRRGGDGKTTPGDELNRLLQVGALYADIIVAAEGSARNYQNVHSSKAAEGARSD